MAASEASGSTNAMSHEKSLFYRRSSERESPRRDRKSVQSRNALPRRRIGHPAASRLEEQAPLFYSLRRVADFDGQYLSA